MQVTIYISFILVLLTPTNHKDDWGFFAHKKINELAIYALPDGIRQFYKTNAEAIIEWSVAPDQRRYVIEEEGMKHYIDLDLYDSFPLPKYWNQAVDKYGKEYLQSRGVIPWNTYFVYRQLVKAMSEKNHQRIIKLSADLGHYMADAHVPLHTTSNYNGQLSGQLGIHAFWESRLPELYFDTYDLFTHRADYIEDIQKEIWETVVESNSLLDTVLYLDTKITETVGEDKKYAYVSKGKRTVRLPSEYFSSQYNKEGGGMVEQRMKKAILRVSSLWFSAWVEAGQPELKTIEIEAKRDSVITDKKNKIVRSHDY